MVRSGRKYLGLAPLINVWLVVVCTVTGSGLRTVLSREQCPLGTALTFDEVEDAALPEKETCALRVGITVVSQLVGWN